jgi:hypothetical protein
MSGKVRVEADPTLTSGCYACPSFRKLRPRSRYLLAGAIFGKAPDRWSIAATFLGKITWNAGLRPDDTADELAKQ